MYRKNNLGFNQRLVYFTFGLGLSLVTISAFYVSSFLAILGVTIAFWSVVFTYIKPMKHVPITLFNAALEGCSNNIEGILAENKSMQKGIYLPPKNLLNVESSLIFVPTRIDFVLPNSQNVEKNFAGNGIFISPPGHGLYKIFEQQLDKPFSRFNMQQLQFLLPKILVEDLGIVEAVDFKYSDNVITVNIKGSAFDTLCNDTDSYPRTHSQIGCVFASAIACTLAKVIGLPLIIQQEQHDSDNHMTGISYRLISNELTPEK
jgi:hypothetical protein